MKVLDKVVIDTDDLDNIVNMFNLLDTVVPEGLQKAIDNFKISGSLDNQNALHLELVQLAASKTGIFGDELFNEVSEEAKEFVNGK